MPIFQDLDVRFKLRRLEIIKHSDRWFGVEPYVIPIFFKIDGERYNAVVRLLNTQAPEEETTQVVETSIFQLQLVSDPEQNPFTFLPPGPVLRAEISDLKDDDVMTTSDLDIKFDTTLKPVPLVIDVLGLADLRDILEVLVNIPIVRSVLDGVETDVLNLAFEDFSELLARFIGLDEEIDSCPAVDLDDDEFINRIEAEFRSLIPGSIGGAFVLMENDDWDEDDVVTAQLSIEDFLRDTINDITNSVTRVNPIPETDIDEAAAQEELTWKLIGDLFFRWDPGFWFSNTVGLLWGSSDDVVGFDVRVFDHQSIAGTDQEFFVDGTGNDNEWKLTVKLELR